MSLLTYFDDLSTPTPLTTQLTALHKLIAKPSSMNTGKSKQALQRELSELSSDCQRVYQLSNAHKPFALLFKQWHVNYDNVLKQSKQIAQFLRKQGFVTEKGTKGREEEECEEITQTMSALTVDKENHYQANHSEEPVQATEVIKKPAVHPLISNSPLQSPVRTVQTPIAVTPSTVPTQQFTSPISTTPIAQPELAAETLLTPVQQQRTAVATDLNATPPTPTLETLGLSSSTMALIQPRKRTSKCICLPASRLLNAMLLW